MKEKWLCGPENVATFNAALRERLPAFHALAKELLRVGLINGLRGVSLESLGHGDPKALSALPVAFSSRFCHECIYWHADTVGDSTGIGRCDIKAQPSRLKWPKQNACHHFGEKQ